MKKFIIALIAGALFFNTSQVLAVNMIPPVVELIADNYDFFKDFRGHHGSRANASKNQRQVAKYSVLQNHQQIPSRKLRAS